jgi:hypothetical protein
VKLCRSVRKLRVVFYVSISSMMEYSFLSFRFALKI